MDTTHPTPVTVSPVESAKMPEAGRANKRPRNSDTGDEKHLWACPICLDPPSESSALQCRNGHVICSLCAATVHSCPICRVEMDPESPIRCLVASQALEHIHIIKMNSEMTPCRGAGCSWMGPSEALKAHEQQCLPAARATIAELALQQQELLVQVKSLSDNLEEMKESQNQLAMKINKEKDETPRKCASEWSPGSLLAAWCACIEQYRLDPLEGAIIEVVRSQSKQFIPYWKELWESMNSDSISEAEVELSPWLHGRCMHPDITSEVEVEFSQWLHLRCRVPGTSFLKGTTVTMDTFYHPIKQTIFQFYELTSSGKITRSIELGDCFNVQVSLKQVLKGMQQAALLPREDVDATTMYGQKLWHCQIKDRHSIPQASDADSGLVSLDQSLLQVFASKQLGKARIGLNLDGTAKHSTTATTITATVNFKGDTAPVVNNALEGYSPSFNPTRKLLLTNLAYKTKESDIEDWLKWEGFEPSHVHKEPYVIANNGRRSYKVDTATVQLWTFQDACQVAEKMDNKVPLYGRNIDMCFI